MENTEKEQKSKIRKRKKRRASTPTQNKPRIKRENTKREVIM